ncbi:MAG: ABC transporter permease, partial [bacterium]|nr:ABC transporter permease [bacterium]
VGVPPREGRNFVEEDLSARRDVVILSHRLWQRRGGVVGQQIEINGKPSTILGIMPRGFHFPTPDTDLWEPYTRLLEFQPPRRDADFASVIGRLKPDVSLRAARADMARVGGLLEEAHPNMPEGFGGFAVNVVSLYEHVYGTGVRPALWLILAAVGSILLIAAANVANLMLARLEARDREFAVRTALGASRWRLASQLLAESGLLAVAGAAVG